MVHNTCGCPLTCGIFVPWSRTELASPALQSGFLSTGQPKKSISLVFKGVNQEKRRNPPGALLHPPCAVQSRPDTDQGGPASSFPLLPWAGWRLQRHRIKCLFRKIRSTGQVAGLQILHSKAAQNDTERVLVCYWPPLHACVHAKSLQSCPTLCDPMICGPSGSSVHGILQARILEWVAMPSSRGSSWSRDQTWVSCLQQWLAGSLPLAPPGSPWYP